MGKIRIKPNDAESSDFDTKWSANTTKPPSRLFPYGLRENADFIHEIGVFCFTGRAVGKIWM